MASNLVSRMDPLHYKSKSKQPRDLENLQMRGIRDIYDFYAKQVKMIGQYPTFTELTDHKKVLNLSKFTKFCSDFNLLNNTREKHKIPLKQLQNIFIRATKCQRVMNFNEFIIALDDLADLYYNSQYDLYFNENLSNLSTEEKKKRLLLLIHCENPDIYSQRLKGFGSNFSAEKKGYRIPEYDLSKKYKFKDQTKIKQKIDIWKHQKIMIEEPDRSKSVPPYARLQAIQKSLLMRPDRITWDSITKNSNLISKNELFDIFNTEDIDELLNNGVKLM